MTASATQLSQVKANAGVRSDIRHQLFIGGRFATQGLGSGLWTRDISRSHRFAREIKTGVVWVNCYKRVHSASPFGGIGQ